MACRLPHTAEEFQQFIKAQVEHSDVERQKAILRFIKRFEVGKQLKRELRECYAACTDISDDRKHVINSFLLDEYRKDAAVIESLWACVYQLEAQIANKIRWGSEENVESDKIELQQKQQQPSQQQGASSSSALGGVLKQQQLPDLNLPQPSYEENVVADNGGLNSDKERELSRLETKLEEEKLANFNPHDDGYDFNNSQTWDHPDYH